MGTNWYIDDETEGDNYDNFPHIGKFIFRKGRKHFIFYKSKQYQLSELINITYNFVVNEIGERRLINELIDELVNVPFKEQDFVFA